MIETITAANGWLNGYVWGWPMIVLLVGTGLLLTILTGGVQFRYLGFALPRVLMRKPYRNDGYRADGFVYSEATHQRSGRGWLIRKISFLRVETTWPVTSFAASLARNTASGALCSAETCLRCSTRFAAAGSLGGMEAVMRVQAVGAMQLDLTLKRCMSTAMFFDSAASPILAAP